LDIVQPLLADYLGEVLEKGHNPDSLLNRANTVLFGLNDCVQMIMQQFRIRTSFGRIFAAIGRALTPSISSPMRKKLREPEFLLIHKAS
jgi:hypothetical protein